MAARDFALVIGPGRIDSGADGPVAKARLFGIGPDQILEYRLIHLRAEIDDKDLERLAETLLADPVDQWWMHRVEHTPPERHGAVTVVETGLRPGVTDREGAELMRAGAEIGIRLQAAAVARRWLIYGQLDDDEVEHLAERVLHNPVIERWARDELAPAHTDPEAVAAPTATIGLTGLDDESLVDLSRDRRLGLTAAEMVEIRRWFAEQGREPTDAELETLAQTWSEHCSHKTFRALIQTADGPINGLLDSYIRGATDRIKAPWVESAFVGNAGIVNFDSRFDIALKAETHNHPSALEPFGGANTGVGGVVRDILGVSAKPIAITDVLCFGPEDLDPDRVPDGVLHPDRIRSGVVAGIADYGNKIGVPNIGGAIVHDPAYTTTPLVFAGCVGLLPRGSNPTRPQTGDFVVSLGGRVGRDGVGGATFSSQTMGVETAKVAGSSVQIGDPVVEKGLIDLVIAAREAGLYTAITDCGAGGLSSAVGEMADSLGAVVDLSKVPRKYPGLSPWEVWLSEAQERMVMAVPDPVPLMALAERWQVEATVIGWFTGDGRLVVKDDEDPVVDLDVGFLHDGRPRLELKSEDPRTPRPPRHPIEAVGTTIEPVDALQRLLAHPSLRSNESVLRTYDHEVLGGTVVRPYDGVEMDGPADGTVIVPPGAEMSDPIRGVAIGIGLSILLGRHDCEAMAWAAVDEAVRNAVVAGADPDRLSLLDNFAWGNPTDPPTLGRLVAACRGCHDAALTYRAPFVSGKDSLFNEFIGPDGVADPVTPTLVITAVGIVPDIYQVPAVGVTTVGNDVWLIGPAVGALGGSYLDEVSGEDRGGHLPGPDPDAVARHREMGVAIRAGLVASAHDLSEGGLSVAAAEWAFAGRLGLTLTVAERHGPHELFGEGPGRYLAEVRPDDHDRFAAVAPSARRIGWVTDDGHVRIGTEIDIPLSEIEVAYKQSATRSTARSVGARSAPNGGRSDAGEQGAASGAPVAAPDSSETPDAETADVGGADAETTGAETADAETADVETADAGGADAETADAGGADAGTADAGGADVETADAGGADAETADPETADAGTADVGGADAETADVGEADDAATPDRETDGGAGGEGTPEERS